MTAGKPLAVVTGASSGIGAEFAKALARSGYSVLLVARRRDRLEALAERIETECQAEAEILVCDLATDEGCRVLEQRLQNDASLAMLVNNAGFGSLGCFFDIPIHGQDQMHRLHVLAPMRLTHAALPGMIERGAGAIINVASVAGFLQTVGNVGYCATKAWMIHFSEGVWLELRASRSPVRIQALCPGYTLSEFHDTLHMDRSKIPASLWMKAEFVVAESLRGIERDQLIVIPGWRYRAMLRLWAVLPRGLRHWFGMRSAAYRQSR